MFSMAFSPPPPLSSPPSAEAPSGFPHSWPQRHSWSHYKLWLWPYLWSTASVVLATLVGIGLTGFAPLPNVSMVYLLTVVFSAVRFGIWPALFTTALSFLAYNFVFIDPHYSFSVTQLHELLSLLVFLVVAVLTSTHCRSS